MVDDLGDFVEQNHCSLLSLWQSSVVFLLHGRKPQITDIDSLIPLLTHLFTYFILSIQQTKKKMASYFMADMLLTR